jgi:hypothetical protein
MQKGQWKWDTKRIPKMQTEGGFRLVFRPGHHYPGQNEATGTRPGAQHSGA